MKWRTSGVTWQRVCRLGICRLGLSTKSEVSTICLGSWILFLLLLLSSILFSLFYFCGLQRAIIAQSRTSSWLPRNIGRWCQGNARKTVNCSYFGYYTPSWLCATHIAWDVEKCVENQNLVVPSWLTRKKITIHERIFLVECCPLGGVVSYCFSLLLLRLVLSCLVSWWLFLYLWTKFNGRSLKLGNVPVANRTFILFTSCGLSRTL